MESNPNPYSPPGHTDEPEQESVRISGLIFSLLSLVVITPAATGMTMIILLPIASIFGAFFDQPDREGIQTFAATASVLFGLFIGFRTAVRITAPETPRPKTKTTF